VDLVGRMLDRYGTIEIRMVKIWNNRDSNGKDMEQ